jgi:hypothetical protein
MELHEALNQIAEIRQQVARTEVFRGYRAVPVVFSGLLAFVIAGVQVIFLPDPAQNTTAFLILWIGVAVVSVAATACEMVYRLRRTSSPLEREKVLLAAGQFLPCLVAGALLMIVLLRFAPGSLWMLPGLWAMLFGLGIFASWRSLPRAILFVGVYYQVAGMVCLALAQGESAFSPWSMAIPFGVGQLLTAAVLYWKLERVDEQA